jgi:hypothetical protein
LTSPSSIAAQWWKLVAAGVTALGAMIIAEGATDLSRWWVMVIVVLAALVSIAAGVVLGLVHLAGTLLHHRAS